MKATGFATGLVLAGILAAGSVVAAPQGDGMAQRMGGQSEDATKTMDQSRDRVREQIRNEDGSGEQYRNQYRYEKQNKGDNAEQEMKMNGSGMDSNGMGGNRMGGGGKR